MQRSFARASSAFESGDHGGARSHADQGKSLKSGLARLTSRRRDLISQMQRAREKHAGILVSYRAAKREFDLAKERFGDQKATVEAAKRDAVFAAGLRHYGDEVVVRHEPNGNTSIYFGGIDRPDGDGHAHYVIDAAGNIIYRRDPFQDRGAQNYRN